MNCDIMTLWTSRLRSRSKKAVASPQEDAVFTQQAPDILQTTTTSPLLSLLREIFTIIVRQCIEDIEVVHVVGRIIERKATKQELRLNKRQKVKNVLVLRHSDNQFSSLMLICKDVTNMMRYLYNMEAPTLKQYFLQRHVIFFLTNLVPIVKSKIRIDYVDHSWYTQVHNVAVFAKDIIALETQMSTHNIDPYMVVNRFRALGVVYVIADMPDLRINIPYRIAKSHKLSFRGLDDKSISADEKSEIVQLWFTCKDIMKVTQKLCDDKSGWLVGRWIGAASTLA